MIKQQFVLVYQQDGQNVAVRHKCKFLNKAPMNEKQTMEQQIV